MGCNIWAAVRAMLMMYRPRATEVARHRNDYVKFEA